MVNKQDSEQLTRLNKNCRSFILASCNKELYTRRESDDVTTSKGNQLTRGETCSASSVSAKPSTMWKAVLGMCHILRHALFVSAACAMPTSRTVYKTERMCLEAGQSVHLKMADRSLGIDLVRGNSTGAMCPTSVSPYLYYGIPTETHRCVTSTSVAHRLWQQVFRGAREAEVLSEELSFHEGNGNFVFHRKRHPSEAVRHTIPQAGGSKARNNNAARNTKFVFI